MEMLPHGFGGKAIVISDQPVAVVVLDYPLLGQADSAIYVGLSAEVARLQLGPQLIPLALKQAVLRGP